ncbi:MBL fold metallo-hydrolase [Streptomyces sp. NPDC046870]|uniref:MBL fold metallo-hydrolase n=1 Tax=Streptomyces sp. NPDC046870 TaxID=3155135 RepID=UPI0034525A51
MKITFLGHAGALIETDEVRLVCDPWFSETGAFLAGWHQLPDNSACAGLLDGATHVYVSHDHEDHFDADVLAALDPSVRLLMPDYRLPGWHRLVSALPGPAPTLLGDGEVFEAGSLRLRLVMSPMAQHQDSALVIEDTATGQVVVNLNDCQVDRTQLRMLRRLYPRIDVVMAQFSGATWFPFAYSFPAEEAAEAAARKRTNSMRRWARYMRALDPRTAVAFAGPPILLDPALTPHFFDPASIFTTPPELLRWLEAEHPGLAARCVAPLPGDVLDVGPAALTPDARIRQDFDWARLEEYTERYARRRAPAIERVLAARPEPRADLFDAFREHFQALFRSAEKTCRAVDAVVGFDIRGAGGGFWLVDFRRLRVWRGGDPEDAGHDYRFTLDSRFLPPILSGESTWEEFFFSFRFTAWRPSVEAYNEELMSVLRRSSPGDLAEHAAQLDRARRQPGGTFRLTTAEGTYLVEDTCPHMGARLQAEDHDPGQNVVVCPQHGWRFEVPGGRCLNGRARLGIVPASPEGADAPGVADPRREDD